MPRGRHPSFILDLPFIDEHTAETRLDSQVVWSSLLGELTRALGRGARLARVLGCDPARASGGFGGFGGRVGETLPGFRVVDAEPGARLTLEGRHRFSRYRLSFVLAPGTVKARTEAEFPGLLGRAYRGLVIGSGGHARITRHLVRRIAVAG